MSTDSPARDLVTEMTRVIRAVDHRGSLEEVLEGLVTGATRIFPEVDHAAVHVTHHHGQIEDLATTGHLAHELSELQQWLREGPTHDAITGEDTVVLQVDQHDDRWPRYTAAASALGLRAQLAVRLYGHTRTAGSMTFLSTAAPEFGPDTQAVAQVYAGHVGAVLGRARSDDHWTSAIDSRQVIGQATGIVMERRGVGADTAFAQLVRISTDTNVKLREVARRLVAGELTLPPPA